MVCGHFWQHCERSGTRKLTQKVGVVREKWRAAREKWVEILAGMGQGAGTDGSSSAEILFLFPASIQLPGSTWICISKISGNSLSTPIAVADASL